MAHVDGKDMHSSSVGRSLARAKGGYGKDNAVTEKTGKPGETGSPLGGEAVKAHLEAAHGESAKGATKSAHLYEKGGTTHLHTHNHETGESKHSEHGSSHEAAQAAAQHLSGGEAPPEESAVETGGEENPLEAMGVSEQGPADEEA